MIKEEIGIDLGININLDIDLNNENYNNENYILLVHPIFNCLTFYLKKDGFFYESYFIYDFKSKDLYIEQFKFYKFSNEKNKIKIKDKETEDYKIIKEFTENCIKKIKEDKRFKFKFLINEFIYIIFLNVISKSFNLK